MAEDPIIQRIEGFRCRRGQLLAERRNRGYTLYRASSGALVARLRPTGQDDRVEVRYAVEVDGVAPITVDLQNAVGVSPLPAGTPVRLRWPVADSLILSPDAR